MSYTLPILLFSIIWGAVEFLVPVKYSEANIGILGISFLFFIASFISLIMDIPAGKFSDKIGRERLIVYSMIISTISLVILYIFTSFAMFLFASILIGIAYGLNWSPLLAFVGDKATKKNRGAVFGDFFTLSALGEAVAPLLIVVIVFYSNLSLPFLILAIASLFCMFAFMRLIKRKKINAKKLLDGEHFSYKNTFKLIKKSLSVNLFLLSLGFFVAFFWESVWFTQPLIGFYESSLLDSALIIATFSLPTLLFSKPLGKLIDLFGEKKIFLYSAFAIIISFILFYLSINLIFKIIFIFIAAIGVSGVWLVMDVLTTKLHKKSERGEFFGILETIRDASYAITPLFIGFSYKLIGLNGIFVVNSAIAFLLFIFGIFIFRKYLK